MALIEELQKVWIDMDTPFQERSAALAKVNAANKGCAEQTLVELKKCHTDMSESIDEKTRQVEHYNKVTLTLPHFTLEPFFFHGPLFLLYFRFSVSKRRQASPWPRPMQKRVLPS